MDRKNLKITFLFSIFIVLFILSTGSVRSIDYSISHSCNKNQCVEGETAEWHVSVSSYGDLKTEVISIELIDSINNSMVAFFNATYKPFTDQSRDIFVILQETKTKTISGIIPKANNKSSLLYYPCFTTAVKNPENVRDDIYSIRVCYEQNPEAMPVLECVLNSSCAYDGFCKENRCTRLSCRDCQYLLSHRCADYECCNNSACRIDQACMDKKCINLTCSLREYLFNNSCQPLNCSYNEAFINHSCVRLNCSGDEFIQDHSCVRLNCSGDEYASDHECIRLDCSDDEYAFNQTCRKLDCLYNETIEDHSCKPLNCYFFLSAVDHRCIRDNRLIFKLSIESVVVLIIISLIIINIKKYRLEEKNAGK
ncbi:hypothetical protein KY366_06590 [Candidatus Woesearchaeota archaeon]|nr:hypothetical protein [Candidatus Woesearchaeota archaeon]